MTFVIVGLDCATAGDGNMKGVTAKAQVSTVASEAAQEILRVLMIFSHCTSLLIDFSVRVRLPHPFPVVQAESPAQSDRALYSSEAIAHCIWKIPPPRAM
jgi:hypothetical protein